MNIEKYDHIPLCPRAKINKLKIPMIRIQYADEFNEIFFWAKSMAEDPENEWMWFERTPSDGISIDRNKLILPAWNVEWTKTGVELILLINEGQYRFIWGAYGQLKKGDLTGREAYLEFMKICQKFDVDLFQFAAEDPDLEKSKIEYPIIDVAHSFVGKELNHVHHLDLNSSYMSGIALANPDLFPVIDHIYRHRHDKTEYGDKCKDILTHTYGFFQSKWCGYNGKKFAFANLSRQAVEYNNRRIRELDTALIENDDIIVSHNVDGIWYIGPEYHGPGEGINLCEWKTDHKDCKARFKSAGSYEYIENGKYYPVVRGLTLYDRVKPREEWEWGDIFRSEAIRYRFSFENGLERVDEE